MKLLNKKLSGDTLIEVLFAFVILSAVISVSFGGAMASYRSALTAQNRTQALFLAQYQADGIKTYRDSLDWDSTGGLPSFLNGKTASLGGDTLTPVALANNSLLSGFCMDTFRDSSSTISPKPYYWKLVTNSADCKALAKKIAPNLNDPQMSIELKYPDNTADRVEAIITVSYIPASGSDPNYREKVTNSIILIQ